MGQEVTVQGLTNAGDVTLNFTALFPYARTPASITNSFTDRCLSLISTRRNDRVRVLASSNFSISRARSVSDSDRVGYFMRGNLDTCNRESDIDSSFICVPEFSKTQFNSTRNQNRPAFTDVQLVVSRLQRRFGHSFDQSIKRLEFVTRDQLRRLLAVFRIGICGFRMDARKTSRFAFRSRKSGGSIGSAAARLVWFGSQCCARRMT